MMESVSNPGEGDYFLSLPVGTTYAFNVSQPGFLFYSDHFELDREYSQLDPFVKDIPLEPITEGRTVVLKNVFFDTDSFTLKDASRIELDKVVAFLEENPSLRVEISGHTDNTGAAGYNMDLSGKRAGEVVEYIVGKGIDRERLEARGYGDTQPVATNDTEEGRQRNRRVEIKIAPKINE